MVETVKDPEQCENTPLVENHENILNSLNTLLPLLKGQVKQGESKTYIRKGMKSPKLVEAMQGFLQQYVKAPDKLKNGNSWVDGDFGKGTMRYLKQAQKSLGLDSADGVIGPGTLEALEGLQEKFTTIKNCRAEQHDLRTKIVQIEKQKPSKTESPVNSTIQEEKNILEKKVPNKFSRPINLTLKVAKRKGLNSEKLEILKQQLEVIAKDPKNKKLSQQDFDRKCTEVRKSFTTDSLSSKKESSSENPNYTGEQVALLESLWENYLKKNPLPKYTANNVPIIKREFAFPGKYRIPNDANNPGNLRLSGNPEIMALAIGKIKTRNGYFLVFPTVAAGLKAKEILMRDYLSNSDRTLQSMISRYAPRSDGNNPVRYARVVAKKLGITSSTKIGELRNKIPELITAMSQQEGFKPERGTNWAYVHKALKNTFREDPLRNPKYAQSINDNKKKTA